MPEAQNAGNAGRARPKKHRSTAPFEGLSRDDPRSPFSRDCWVTLWGHGRLSKKEKRGRERKGM